MQIFLLILIIFLGIASLITFFYGLIKSNKILIASIFMMTGTILISIGRNVIDKLHKGGSSLVYIGLTLAVIATYILYQTYETYKEKKKIKKNRNLRKKR